MKGNPAFAGRPLDEYADVVQRLRALDCVGFFLALAATRDNHRSRVSGNVSETEQHFVSFEPRRSL